MTASNTVSALPQASLRDVCNHHANELYDVEALLCTVEDRLAQAEVDADVDDKECVHRTLRLIMMSRDKVKATIRTLDAAASAS
jgi:hypothetical protein